MASALPSYDEAISRDPWPIVAKRLPANTLFTTCLVNRKWYNICIAELWGDPFSTFPNIDAAISGLTRFLFCIGHARRQVRSLTHTLTFPPAHVEAYGGIGDDWLRDTFELLPNLRLLNVRRLSFFEHSALLKLVDHYIRLQKLNDLNATAGLRYLDASNCTYLSTESLYRGLAYLPHLVYLDLSSVYPAVQPGQLSALAAIQRSLPYLRVLKLRNTGLRDPELEVLARRVQRRLKYLDVRGNYLTDKSCKILSEECIGTAPSELQQHYEGVSPADLLFDRTEGELETGLRQSLCKLHLDSVAFEETSPGLTHLYISDNTAITPPAILGLLETHALTCLDASIVHKTNSVRFDPSTLTQASKALRHLRIPWTFLRVSIEPFDKLPALKTLVLTNIPPTAKDTQAAETICALLTAAGRRASLLRETARTSYTLPPGRRTLNGLKAQTLVDFPLRKIILETSAPDSEPVSPPGLSTTGDADSEAFYAASEKDFTFFGGDEADSLPGAWQDSSKRISLRPSWPYSNQMASSGKPHMASGDVVDTIAHIAAMRRRQRAVYEAREAKFKFGNTVDPHWELESYWPGEVQIVRK